MFPRIALSSSLSVNSWGLFVFIAALAVLWFGRINAPARGLPPALIERLWPWLLLGGFAGAHLYYLVAVAGWPFHRAAFGELCNIFSGTAVQGGILGGACAAAVYLRRKGYPILPVCDVLSPGGALAQGVTRVGCFAAGCCYGRPTKFFLGVIYWNPLADPATPRGIPLHPAQLYEAVLDACLAAFLQRRLKAPAPPGTVFSLYLAGAAAIRFGVEFFRGDDAGRLTLGLAHSQFMAIAMLATAAALFDTIRRGKRI